MRRVIFIIFIYVSLPFLHAQSDHEMKCIREFLGTDADEEIDSYEVEILEGYLARPLRINQLPGSKLISSGLLTNYQVASLLDYRKTSGDVLSFNELAAVDGFGSEFVKKLAPFISLDSSGTPGQTSERENEWYRKSVMRAGYRNTEGGQDGFNWGTRYQMETTGGNRISFAFSRPSDADGFSPQNITGNVVWNFNHDALKLVVGDFNARFGQGLGLWNGLVLSGLSSPSSFYRNASGVTGSSSFTGTYALTGAALRFAKGRFAISALSALPGIKTSGKDNGFSLLPAINIGWYGSSFSFSVTDYCEFSGLSSQNVRIPHMKTSADMSLCLKGTDLFSEIAYDWVNRVPAILAGTSFPFADGQRIAMIVRYYSPSYDSYLSAAPRTGSKCSDEAALSAAGDFVLGRYVTVNGQTGFGSSVRRLTMQVSVDASAKTSSIPWISSFQLKFLLSLQYMISDRFRLDLRYKERFRNYGTVTTHSNVRMTFSYLSRKLVAAIRAETTKAVEAGIVTYLEGGYKTDKLAAYLRQGIFFVDNWDDRIYVYERDAPGSYNVPAYYGRGLWSAFNVSWRFAKWGRLYARISLLSYPFMDAEKKKPGKTELKLQTEFSF